MSTYWSIEGKKVVWCGDGNNVCASFLHAAGQFGFDFTFTGPVQLDPEMEFVGHARQKGVEVTIERDPIKAAEGADLIITDTWVSMHDAQSARERRHNMLRPYQVNEALIDAACGNGCLKRFVHISSLGVYAARDHHGTDESEPPDRAGIDGYTLTKVESEDLARERFNAGSFPLVVLRPGFVYGARDRTVLPRLVERLGSGGFKYLGSGEQLLNNVYIDNLVDAVFLAISRDDVLGEVFNITDDRLVSKREFIGTIARGAGLEEPTKSVPLGVAKVLATLMEGTWKLLGKQEAPLLSGARIKFLGLNLDFDIGKARRELGYQPAVEFAEGMGQTIQWCRQTGLLS